MTYRTALVADVVPLVGALERSAVAADAGLAPDPIDATDEVRVPDREVLGVRDRHAAVDFPGTRERIEVPGHGGALVVYRHPGCAVAAVDTAIQIDRPAVPAVDAQLEVIRGVRGRRVGRQLSQAQSRDSHRRGHQPSFDRHVLTFPDGVRPERKRLSDPGG